MFIPCFLAVIFALLPGCYLFICEARLDNPFAYDRFALCVKKMSLRLGGLESSDMRIESGESASHASVLLCTDNSLRRKIRLKILFTLDGFNFAIVHNLEPELYSSKSQGRQLVVCNRIT